jgi:mannose-6-phosphate isomerase-like protein (cupin superfamily)
MKKFQKYIKKGVVEPLENIPFHGKAPLTRHLMLNKKIIPESNTIVSVHYIKKITDEVPKYTELHTHDCDEINLILSEDDTLVYEVQFEDEVYEVKSPATIYIPKGIKHSASVKSGKGMFVCVIMQGEYRASE